MDVPTSNNTADTSIDIAKEEEVKYWSRELRITPSTLKEAVRKVGPFVEEVKQWVEANAHSHK